MTCIAYEVLLFRTADGSEVRYVWKPASLREIAVSGYTTTELSYVSLRVLVPSLVMHALRNLFLSHESFCEVFSELIALLHAVVQRSQPVLSRRMVPYRLQSRSRWGGNSTDAHAFAAAGGRGHSGVRHGFASGCRAKVPDEERALEPVRPSYGHDFDQRRLVLTL